MTWWTKEVFFMVVKKKQKVYILSGFKCSTLKRSTWLSQRIDFLSPFPFIILLLVISSLTLAQIIMEVLTHDVILNNE